MQQVLKAPWDRVSVAGLAAGAAATHGARLFIRDCPDRLAWNGEEPRALGFAEFNHQALFFAAQMQAFGLDPGARLLLLMPNSVELAIAVVGARAAGLVPVIAPIEESTDAIRAAAEQLQPAGLVTTGRVEDMRLAERARQIAARLMSIRCVAGFGFDLPDGVSGLDGWSDEDVMPLANALAQPQSREALITFARVEGVLTPFIRSEAQLVSDALALASRARLPREARILSTIQPGSAAAVVAGLLLPLFLGMSVQLVGPFRSARLVQAMADDAPRVIVAPAGAMAGILALSGMEDRPSSLVGAIAVRRPAETDVLPLEPTVPLTTLLDLDEAALLPLGAWPAAGATLLDGAHAHPMEDILPDGTALLHLGPAQAGVSVTGGFGEARVMLRARGLRSPDAA